MEEIWKPVKYKGVDYTDIYEVSNLGNFRSLRKNKVLIPTKSSIEGGYHWVTLSKSGEQKRARIHVLVWTVFKYEPCKGYVIHHKDADGLNNNLSNLDCITNRENLSIERTIKSGLPVGVQRSRNKYMSRITTLGNIKVYLGVYKDKNKASKAYQIALKIIQSNPNATKEEIQHAVSNYRESIGLKRIKTRK